MRCKLALIFMFISSQNVIALQAVNAQDYLDIVAQINKKNAAEDEITIYKEALRKAGRNEALKREINIEIARLEKERKAAYEQALWLTIRAYDIIPFADNEPILDERVSVLRSPEKGKSITWVPIFDEVGAKPDQGESGPNGPDRGVRMIDLSIGGNTSSDGISRIFPRAFSSPEMLASIIIHEQLHFTQNTSQGQGDAKTTAELEVEAYEKEQKLMGILGFSGESKRIQKERLAEALNGKDGKPGKRALAKKERAEADKSRGGRPLPERSLVSLPEDEIQRLIRQAKEQISIAQRDHDERLKRTWVDLAQRSCANPGSITQFELDSLPRLHRRDNGGGVPSGLGDCGAQVYILLAYEANAEQIRSASTPQAPANLGRVSKPIAVQPAPRPVPNLVVARIPFWPVLPRLQKYAVAACRSSGPVPIDTSLTQPRPPFTFSRDIDDRTAAELSAGLGSCEGQLFRRLIEVIRSGQGDRITAQWVQETAAGYRTTPGTPPGRGAPPQDREPPPDRKHPDIVIPKPPWEKGLKGRAK